MAATNPSCRHKRKSREFAKNLIQFLAAEAEVSHYNLKVLLAEGWVVGCGWGGAGIW